MPRSKKVDAKNLKFKHVGHDRNTSSGKYYAIFRKDGKQIWKSLRTTDLALAKRNADKIDRSLASRLKGAIESEPIP